MKEEEVKGLVTNAIPMDASVSDTKNKKTPQREIPEARQLKFDEEEPVQLKRVKVELVR